MGTRDEAFLDYKSGMKYKDIAEKYGVSLSCVKSWASRYWKSAEVATKKEKSCNRKEKRTQPKPRGAPKGNTNAKGNSGGGAPLGNKNSLKHGGYSAVYFDTLDCEERDLIEAMPKSTEEQLIMQIQLYSVRERRLMKAIDKYRSAKTDNVIDSITTIQQKKHFNSEEDKETYDKIRFEKIKEGKISYLYDEIHQSTVVAPSIKTILSLEAELSKVQRQKTIAIEAIEKLQKTVKKDNEASAPVAVSDAEVVNIYIPDNGRDKT